MIALLVLLLVVLFAMCFGWMIEEDKRVRAEVRSDSLRSELSFQIQSYRSAMQEIARLRKEVETVCFPVVVPNVSAYRVQFPGWVPSPKYQLVLQARTYEVMLPLMGETYMHLLNPSYLTSFAKNYADRISHVITKDIRTQLEAYLKEAK